ncbi:TIR domain-containing protein [Saccharothrix sp. S26]|uniref:TIR domain-containing protein n=1 Tax=Saccharothrix sp. S26 TaxID=2907215 RepID=UPI001F2CCAF2|nr:TIR domain-containing protein [Saccharothrix sp. S26]MCE6997967.1 TIR domain-containing protein [Saccharothrix sp. S26]
MQPANSRLSGAARDDGADPPDRPAPSPPARYSAFISYSRAVDGKLAPALASALRVFAKPWYRRRALRVFRDDDSLSANPGLWSSIRAGLDSSEFFILLASPEAAASPWVEKEVAHWLEHRPVERLLIVVTDGELTWDGGEHDFDPTTTNCLPPALYGAFREEPRWADLRGARGEDNLSLRSAAFKDVVADLVAALRQVSKDEIVGEDLRQHRRTRSAVVGAVASLLVLAAVASLTAVVAIRRGQAAEEQRSLAEAGRRTAISRQVATTAANTVARDPRTALRLAVAAHHIHPGAETRAALHQALTATSYAGRLPGSPSARQSFFPDGRAVVVSEDDRVKIWDVGGTQPVEVASVPTTGQPALSPDGRTLIVVPPRYEPAQWVEAWDVRDRVHPEKMWRKDATVAPFSVVFSADSRLIALQGQGDSASTIVLWDVSDPRQPVPRAELEDDVTSLAFAPDNRTLALGSGARTDGTDADMIITLWDVGAGAAATRLGSTRFTSGGYVTSLQFAGSGNLLTAGGDGPQGNTDVAAILVDVTDRGRPRQLAAPFEGSRTKAVVSAFDPTSSLLATSGGPDRAVRLWDIRDPAEPFLLESLTGHTDHVREMSFSPDGGLLLTGDATGESYLWSVAGRGRPRRSGHVAGAAVTLGGPLNLSALAAGDTMLVTADGDAALAVWTVNGPADPERTATIDLGGEPDAPPTAVAISPDERLVAVGVRTALASTVRLWDVSDRANPRLSATTTASSVGGIVTLSFTPDGRSLVVGGSHQSPAEDRTGVVEVLDVGGDVPLTRVGTFTLPRVVSTAEVSPDGRLLALGGGFEYWEDDGMFALWDLTDRTHPRDTGASSAREGADIGALAFTPDSRTLAVVQARNEGDGSAREIVLWDVTDPAAPGRAGQVFTAHEGGVTSVAFASDGLTMASTGQEADGRAESLMLWDLTDFPRVHPIGPLSYGNENSITTVAFGADDRRLMTGGIGSGPGMSTTLWDLSGLHDMRSGAVARACEIAGGGLDPVEWRIHVPELEYEATC